LFSENIKVLYIEPSVTRQIGGAQVFEKLLMENLSSKFEFTVISSFYDFYTNIKDKRIIKIRLNKFSGILSSLLEKIYKLNNRKLVLVLSLIPFTLYLYEFSKFIKREWKNCNVIMSGDGYYQSELACLLAGVRDKPHMHILNSAEPLRLRGIPFFNSWAIKFLGFYANFNRITFVALNESTKHEFEKLFPGRSTLIGIGVNTEEYKPVEFRLRKNNVLFMGRLDEKQKNVSLLIKAFALLMDKTYSLIIAGTGNDIEYYNNMISMFHLEDRCKLLGYVSHEKSVELLSTSKIFVNTSIREGQSNAVLEAMSCGCATVCVDNLGTRATIKNYYNGIIIENSVDELIRVLDNLMDDDNLVMKLSQNARKTAVEKFSICKVTRLYEENLVGLMNDKHEA
jgi:glycosyltransferase involved in cell wall biosynthesis